MKFKPLVHPLNKRIESTAEVKGGDLVAFPYDHGGVQIVKVERVTKTLIIGGNDRLNPKATGVYVVTPELLTSIRRARDIDLLYKRVTTLARALNPWGGRPDISRAAIDALNAACDLVEQEAVG